MDISIGVHGVINIGGLQLLITDTIVSTWIVMGVLIALAIVVRVKVCRFKEIPTGFQNIIEAIVEVFENYLQSTVGPKLMFLGNWFFTLFLFILLSNIGGIMPGFRPPTADWAMTVALALVTFVLIQSMGVRYRKTAYIKGLFAPLPWWFPIPLFLPMNLIGEIARPISISFRLFGNMLAGLIMMSLIYSIAPVASILLLPAALHVYFDIFAGLIQTYIFVTLSMAFIADAAKLTD